MTDSVNRAELAALARDVVVKATDAEGSRSARLITVIVHAAKAGKPEAGWTVFYDWVPGPKGQSRVLPDGSGPLAPGLYSFHAEKMIAGRKVLSEIKEIPLAGYPKITILLNVP